MIRVDHVSKQYNGKYVVSDVNFEVDRDETLVLLGTIRSGKTTTLKMNNRLIVADEGMILSMAKTSWRNPLEIHADDRICEHHYNLKWLRPLGSTNSYALMMRREEAEQFQIQNISQLSDYVRNN
jgi:ABC-type multidrug transport system ATPase subunit